MEIKEVNDVRVINLIMATADKEYEIYFPKGTQFFTLHVRDGTAIRLSHSQGKVAGSEPPYFTLKANTSWDEDKFFFIRNLRLYAACGSAGKVIEIIAGVFDPSKEVDESLK